MAHVYQDTVGPAASRPTACCHAGPATRWQNVWLTASRRRPSNGLPHPIEQYQQYEIMWGPPHCSKTLNWKG